MVSMIAVKGMARTTLSMISVTAMVRTTLAQNACSEVTEIEDCPGFSLGNLPGAPVCVEMNGHCTEGMRCADFSGDPQICSGKAFSHMGYDIMCGWRHGTCQAVTDCSFLDYDDVCRGTVINNMDQAMEHCYMNVGRCVPATECSQLTGAQESCDSFVGADGSGCFCNYEPVGRIWDDCLCEVRDGVFCSNISYNNQCDGFLAEDGACVWTDNECVVASNCEAFGKEDCQDGRYLGGGDSGTGDLCVWSEGVGCVIFDSCDLLDGDDRCALASVGGNPCFSRNGDCRQAEECSDLAGSPVCTGALIRNQTGLVDMNGFANWRHRACESQGTDCQQVYDCEQITDRETCGHRQLFQWPCHWDSGCVTVIGCSDATEKEECNSFQWIERACTWDAQASECRLANGCSEIDESVCFGAHMDLSNTCVLGKEGCEEATVCSDIHDEWCAGSSVKADSLCTDVCRLEEDVFSDTGFTCGSLLNCDPDVVTTCDELQGSIFCRGWLLESGDFCYTHNGTCVAADRCEQLSNTYGCYVAEFDEGACIGTVTGEFVPAYIENVEDVLGIVVDVEAPRADHFCRVPEFCLDYTDFGEEACVEATFFGLADHNHKHGNMSCQWITPDGRCELAYECEHLIPGLNCDGTYVLSTGYSDTQTKLVPDGNYCVSVNEESSCVAVNECSDAKDTFCEGIDVNGVPCVLEQGLCRPANKCEEIHDMEFCNFHTVDLPCQTMPLNEKSDGQVCVEVRACREIHDENFRAGPCSGYQLEGIYPCVESNGLCGYPGTCSDLSGLEGDVCSTARFPCQGLQEPCGRSGRDDYIYCVGQPGGQCKVAVDCVDFDSEVCPIVAPSGSHCIVQGNGCREGERECSDMSAEDCEDFDDVLGIECHVNSEYECVETTDCNVFSHSESCNKNGEGRLVNGTTCLWDNGWCREATHCEEFSGNDLCDGFGLFPYETCYVKNIDVQGSIECSTVDDCIVLGDRKFCAGLEIQENIFCYRVNDYRCDQATECRHVSMLESVCLSLIDSEGKSCSYDDVTGECVALI